MKMSGRRVSALTAIAVCLCSWPVRGQSPQPDVVFRSRVDVVSVAAVVRDRQNRVVSSLTREQFQVFDAGQPQSILDVQADASLPATVALLVDGSGSMRLGAATALSRRIGEAVLASLDPTRDYAGLMTFDRRLITLQPFTSDFARVRASLANVEAWGSTSLYDAIAGAAGMVAGRTLNRRALVVLTDGFDTGSRYSPDQVAGIASSIDVPVYVFALAGEPFGADALERAGALRRMAESTGGALIIANTPTRVDAGIARLVEELRHQYLISFRATAYDGMRRLEVRTKRKDLTVRARTWYAARQGE